MRMLLLLLACSPPPSTPPDDSPDLCADGELRDGEVCVPAACGLGPWGDVAVDDATVYVDAGAAEGGDGSAAAPFPRVRDGLDLAASRGGAVVALAAGTYVENLRYGSEIDGVQLRGRCAELVILDGSGSEDEAALEVEPEDARTPDLAISGLTVTGGYAGLRLARTRAHLADLVLDRNHFVGLLAYESAEVVLEDSDVRDTQPTARNTYG